MTVFVRNGNTVAVVNSSGSNSIDVTLDGSGSVLRISNPGANSAYIKTGVGAQTATTSDLHVNNNDETFLRIPVEHTHAAIFIVNAGTLYVIRGESS